MPDWVAALGNGSAHEFVDWYNQGSRKPNMVLARDCGHKIEGENPSLLMPEPPQTPPRLVDEQSWSRYEHFDREATESSRDVPDTRDANPNPAHGSAQGRRGGTVQPGPSGIPSIPSDGVTSGPSRTSQYGQRSEQIFHRPGPSGIPKRKFVGKGTGVCNTTKTLPEQNLLHKPGVDGNQNRVFPR